MRKIKRLFFLLLLPAVIAGCSSVTNLTPSQYQRNATGYYHLEAAWSTRQNTIRPETIKPSVMVGFDHYDMRPVPLVQDRWEAFVPIASDQTDLHYRFKFDYMVDAISAPRPDSFLSQEYKLQVVDK